VVENPGFWELGIGNWEILTRKRAAQLDYPLKNYNIAIIEIL
jgi:hypothetical protein